MSRPLAARIRRVVCALAVPLPLPMFLRLAVVVPLTLGSIDMAFAVGPVSLLEAVRLTLAQNPDIQLQEKQVDSSQGALQRASGQFDSALSLTAGRNVDNTPLNQQDRFGFASQGFSVSQIRTETTSYNLSLDTPLRNGIVLSPSLGVTSNTGTVNELSKLSTQNQGKLNFIMRVPLQKGSGESAAAFETAANLEWEASKQDLRFSIAQNILNTATTYWSLLAAGKNLDVAREAEAGIRQMVADTRKLIQADELPAADLNLLKANLLDRATSRNSAEQALLDARQRLGQAIGLPYAQIHTLEPAAGFPALDSVSSDLNIPLSRLIALAMKRRADLAAAKLREESARGLTKAAQASLKPQLDATFSVGYAGLVEGGNSLAALSQNRGGANIGASISYRWPFDNNAARGTYKQQAAIYDQSTVRTSSVERAIGIGVESALSGLVHSSLQLKESEEMVELYRIAVENEKTKHKLGTATLIDVLNVNDRLLGARLSNISYRFSNLNALAQLNFVTGALLTDEESGQSIRLDQLISMPKLD